jgi:hypothetical protein
MIVSTTSPSSSSKPAIFIKLPCYTSAMKLRTTLQIASLLLLAFALYLIAPLLRSKISPTPPIVSVTTPLTPVPTAPVQPTSKAPEIATKPLPTKRSGVPASPTAKSELASLPIDTHAPITNPPVPTADVPDEPPATIAPPKLKNLKINPGKLITNGTIDVLAGQEIHLTNETMSWARITSSLPIMVHVGACKATSTTDITCTFAPNIDLHFQDLRIGVDWTTEPVNRVHVVAMHDAS